MAKSIKKNYMLNLSYQLLVMITPLITTPYLSRVLGADGIGVDSYIQSVSSYFVLFATLGLTTFGQREISYLQDDREKRSILFWETNILEMLFTGLSLVAYIFFSLNQSNKELYFVLVINLLSVIANITWLFQGLEEFGKIVFRNFVCKILNIVFIFIVVHEKNDLFWYMLGTAMFTFLGNISLWAYIPKYIDKPNIKSLKPFRHLKTVLSLFVPTMAIQIYTVLDKTMIGIITSDSFQNGYYEQAIKISKMVMMIVTSLGTVMIPRIGFNFEKGEKEEVSRLMYRGYRFVWFMGIPLCFGLFCVAGNFVPWFFGEGFTSVIPLLQITSFLILAIGINNVTGVQYLIPTKRQNTFTVTVIIGACVNLVMNCILINALQAVGAAIASVIAETVIAVVQLVIVRKELKPFVVIGEGVNYYVAGTIMGAILLLVGKVLKPSFINTAILVIIGGAVYSIGLIILKDEFLLSNVEKVFKKVRRK